MSRWPGSVERRLAGVVDVNRADEARDDGRAGCVGERVAIGGEEAQGAAGGGPDCAAWLRVFDIGRERHFAVVVQGDGLGETIDDVNASGKSDGLVAGTRDERLLGERLAEPLAPVVGRGDVGAGELSAECDLAAVVDDGVALDELIGGVGNAGGGSSGEGNRAKFARDCGNER